MNTSLWSAARQGGYPPPIIGIDQEGGQLIAIMNGATELPGNMALGAARSAKLAEQAGYVLGRELLAMGVNLNFAPSVDININPDNPVIGIRAFGDDPALVAKLGAALIKGMQAQGVIAAAKHFPGHGDTAVDTHYTSPIVPHDIERLQAVELLPFIAAIKANVGAILSAHVTFSALDPDNPATISKQIITGLLRERLHYDGLIITDAMDMYAVARLGASESVSAALNAGVDLVLLGHMKDQISLINAFKPKLHPEALARITAARFRLPMDMPDLNVVGCDEHQAIAQGIADRSITLVWDKAHQLPLNPTTETQIGVITIEPRDLTPADTSSKVQIRLADTIRARHPDPANVITHQMPMRGGDSDVRAALDAVNGCSSVIVGTIQATHDPAQAALIQALRERGQTPIVIALREPYDVMAFPQVETYLCAYGIRPVTMEAIARVLFGAIPALGILPTTIPGVQQWTTA
jgi:beta-N-acetylhexosaminidase